MKEMTEGVESFRVAATINPAMVKPERAKEMGFRELEIDPTQNVKRGMASYKKLGAVPAYTCCPFFVYIPRLGEHLGGAESVAVVFNNAFFGARVNRESGPTALAAAVTGRVPEWGMHLPENRYGELLVEIDKGLKPEEFNDADYNAMAYYVGEKSHDRIPVFLGLLPNMDLTQIKYTCAPLGVSAGLPLCHIVGVTPEAPTLQAAFGGRKPLDQLEFGKQELKDAYSHLSSATDERVDAVTIGCPHATLKEIKECARLLSGKNLAPDMRFWIGTVETVRVLAERLGYVETIEKAGGFVVSDMCAHGYFYCRGSFIKKYRIRNVATNSAKAAHYINAAGTAKIWFGSLEKCVKTAISGRWE